MIIYSEDEHKDDDEVHQTIIIIGTEIQQQKSQKIQNLRYKNGKRKKTSLWLQTIKPVHTLEGPSPKMQKYPNEQRQKN